MPVVGSVLVVLGLVFWPSLGMAGSGTTPASDSGSASGSSFDASSIRANDQALAQTMRTAADNPPFHEPCGYAGGYAYLLTRYAPLIEKAKQTDAGTSPEIEAARYLQERAADYLRGAYLGAADARDRHILGADPDAIDRDAGGFDCLGSYRDSRAESARLRALAVDLRTREIERQRCEKEPVCRARQEAEDNKRDMAILAKEICSELADRRDMKANLDRRNPRAIGVPSRSEREGMKEAMRFFDLQIAEKSAMYREAMGVRFSPKLCK